MIEAGPGIANPSSPTSSDGAESYTIARPFMVRGIGLHTGHTCQVTLEPADRPGYRFITASGAIDAHVASVASTTRATILGHNGAQVQTVEHLLSALYGLGIAGARIQVEGEEIPILDGSARPWIPALEAAGRCPLAEPAPRLRITRPLSYFSGRASYLALPGPPGELWLTFVSNGVHPMVCFQSFSTVLTARRYAEEVAPARTWVFREELDALLAAGLGQGGSLDNAIVIDGTETSSPLRFPDEPIRHKALDLIGDLSLAGARIYGHVLAVGGGHQGNVAFAAALLDAFEIDRF